MKMKRAVAIFLAALMVVTTLPQTAYADEHQIVQDGDGEKDSEATEKMMQTKQEVSSEQLNEEKTGDEKTEQASEKQNGEEKTKQASEEQTEEENTEQASEEQTEEETERASEEQTEEETERASEEKEQIEEATEINSTEAIVAETTEQYTFLTDGQTLYHTDYFDTEYMFVPKKSGYYYLYAESKTDCSFTLKANKTIYYEEVDGENEEKTKTNYDYINETTAAGRVIWLNKDEKYIFKCSPWTYEDRNDIKIGITMKYVGNLQKIETVQTPVKTSYNCLNLSGMKVKLTFAQGIEITEDVKCYVSESNEVVYINCSLPIFQWNSIAQDNSEYIGQWINVNTIDNNSETEFKDLEDGTHKAEMYIVSQKKQDGSFTEDQRWSFSTDFKVKKSNVESIDVVKVQSSYKEGYCQYLKNAKIRVNYNDGTAPEELITGEDSSEARQYLEYTTADGKTVQTVEIDEYLKNGGKTGTATVYVVYRGAKTSYEISVEESPYAKIEIEPKKKVYYAECSYQDTTGKGNGDEITNDDIYITVHWKNGKTKKYNAISDLPSTYTYRYGITNTDENGNINYYYYIDDYISNGGEVGTRQLKFEWMGLEATAEVEIRQNPYDHIKIIQEPVKKTYVYNSKEQLQLSGIEIYAYKDAEETSSNYDVYSYDSEDGVVSDWKNYLTGTLGGHNEIKYLEKGQHTVSVYFMGKKATYDIEVVDKVAQNLEIIQTPSELTYYENETTDEADLYGMQLSITDKDGNVHKYQYECSGMEDYEDWSDISGEVFVDYSEVNWKKAGNYPITVSYMGASDTFEITIEESPASSIEILQMPDKIAYYQYEQDSITLRGMKYRIHFKDNTVEEYTIEDDTARVSGKYNGKLYYGSTEWAKIGSGSLPSIGDNAFIVKIFGQTCKTGTVKVLGNVVESIEITKNPEKMFYLQKEKRVDMYGAELTITYIDGTQKNIAVNEHTNAFVVDDEYKGTLSGALWNYGNENNRRIGFSYMGQTCTVEMDIDFSSMGAEVLTNETKVQATITKDKTYQLYSFTPETTGIYYFYSLSNIDTYAELYQENKILYASHDRKNNYDYECGESYHSGYSSDENFCIEKKLTAGTTYYYAVFTQSDDYCEENGDAVFDVCISSTDIKQMKVSSFKVTKVNKDTWYDFESQSIYLDSAEYELNGVEIQLTYENGWTEKYNIDIYDTSFDINGKTLSAKWKYTETDENGDLYLKRCDDNAIVFTYGEESYEVKLKFNAESPVKSIKILNDPLKNNGIYEYETDLYMSKLAGLKVSVQYKDEREDDTLEWIYDEENNNVISPYLNGYRAEASVYRCEDADEDYELTVQYMGVSVSENIVILPNPVTDITIINVPDKMSYFVYEGDKIYTDLYGLKICISFRDGGKQTVQITDHGNMLPIDNSYKGKISGNITYEYDDTDDEHPVLYVSYLGYNKKVGEYTKKSFNELGSAEELKLGESKDVELDSSNVYKVFAATVLESGIYTFASTSNNDTTDNYAELYSISGTRLASNDDGGDNSCFSLTYDLTAGKTYYLVVRMYSVGNSGRFTCALNKADPVQKQNIDKVVISIANTQADCEFPDINDIEGDNFYVYSYRWMQDEEDDWYADYATAHRVKIVLQPSYGYNFTTATKLTVNGKKIIEKSVGSDGKITLYYTFPYTECKVSVPYVEGYETDLTQNASQNRVNYGENYKFRFIKNEDNTSNEKLIVKANDIVLTPDTDGYYCIEKVKENITVFVKTENVNVDSDVDTKLTLHNQSEAVYDILTGKKSHSIAENENGEKSLPVLESYTDGSDQFFYGWYDKKNENLNGTGARFTSNTVLKDPKYELYAKWESGLFTNVLNGKTVHYKVLQIDENNRIKVQIGDGSNRTVNKASTFSRLAAYAAGTSDALVIPETLSVKGTELENLGIDWGECQVVAIAENAFAGESGISSVTLPDTIESIGANAFDGCTDLQEIVIPEGVSSIGTGAFSGCENLENVSIPSTVTDISEGTFSGCENLTSVKIAEGVTTIGANAFSGCTNLSTVVLPDTLETVDETAFTSENKDMTIICSTDMADTDVIKNVKDATGAAVQKVDISVNYNYDAKEFTCGEDAQTFTASITVDGTEVTDSRIEWTYTETDAYTFKVNGNSITVTPVRTTRDDEQIVISATDSESNKTRSIMLTTKQIDLTDQDSDGDAFYIVEIKDGDNFTYTGKPICPEIIVKQNYTNNIISADNYDISYSDNTDVGIAQIVISGKGNYTGILEKNFTIAKKDQIITAEDITKQFGDPAFTITAKTDGDGALSYSSSDTKVAVINVSGKTEIKGAGKTVITITAAETATCQKAQKQIVLNVNKKTQTITAEDITKQFGDPAFTITAKTEGDGVLNYSSSDTKVAVINVSGKTEIKGAGKTVITITAAETANYQKAQKQIALNVNKGTQTVTAKDQSKTVGDKAFGLNAKTSGNGALSYKSNNEKVAAVDGSGTVSIKGAGKATITVKASATANYKEAEKSITITVAKADSGLSVKKKNYSKVMGDKAFNIGAAAKSSITYKSSNKKVVTVDKKGKLTIKGCGKAVITVSAGNSNYKSAEIKVTVKVVPKKAALKSLGSKKAGQLTVSWSKQKEAKGYVVEYSTDKKFKKKVKSVTINKNGTKSTTLKKLSKGKKYYVRVKAYTIIDKKKSYGKVSKVLNKTVKK